MDDLSLEVDRVVAAPRRKVFEAWLSPALLAQIMQPPGTDGSPARVETDAVEGGRFTIIMPTPERDVPHTGTYLTIDRHERLSFTWSSPHSLDDSVVTIDFAEMGPDCTRVTLRQVKFRNEGARDGHVKGWTAIIGRIETALSRATA